MKRVWIDFRHPLPPLVRTLRVILLAGGVLVLGYALLRQQQVGAEKTALTWQKQSLSRLEARKLPALRAQATTGATQDAARYANDILRQLNMPWDGLFSALERSVSKDISILSVAPDPHKDSITLKAAAPDTGAAIDFMERLQASGMLKTVYLQNQEVDEDRKRRPLLFTLAASWEAPR